MAGRAYTQAEAEEVFADFYRLIDVAEAAIEALNAASDLADSLREQGFRPGHEISDGIRTEDVYKGGTWLLHYAAALPRVIAA